MNNKNSTYIYRKSLTFAVSEHIFKRLSDTFQRAFEHIKYKPFMFESRGSSKIENEKKIIKINRFINSQFMNFSCA